MSTAGIGVNTVCGYARRGDLTKIPVHAQAQIRALFRVELRADHVVVRDDGREVQAVVGRADRDLRVVWIRVVGVDEIKVRRVRYALQQRVGAPDGYVVPADLRHFEAVLGGKASNRAREDGQALHASTFFAPIEK